MPTAQGSVMQTGDPSLIVAMFALDDDRDIAYVALVPKSVPIFNSPTVLMTYATEDDLTGSPHFTCVLGPVTLAMTIGAHVTVAGPIDKEINPPLTIRGKGSWVASSKLHEEASRRSYPAEYRCSLALSSNPSANIPEQRRYRIAVVMRAFAVRGVV